MSSISGKSLFSPQVTFEEFCGKSGKKRRTTPSDATHEIIVYGRSKTANVNVFFFRKLVFMVLSLPVMKKNLQQPSLCFQMGLHKYFFLQVGNFLDLNKIISSSIFNGFFYFFFKMITRMCFYHCAKFQHCPYLRSGKKKFCLPPPPPASFPRPKLVHF